MRTAPCVFLLLLATLPAPAAVARVDCGSPRLSRLVLAEPDITAPIVKKLRCGEPVEIIAEGPGGWTQIRADGMEGWVVSPPPPSLPPEDSNEPGSSAVGILLFWLLFIVAPASLWGWFAFGLAGKKAEVERVGREIGLLRAATPIVQHRLEEERQRRVWASLRTPL